MVEIPKCNTKISKNTNYIANDKSQVQKHLAVKEESQMPLNILLAVNCYQKNLLKITAFEDAGFKYSIKIIPKKERPNNIQPVQIMSPEETAGTLEKMSLFDLLAKIINLESKDAAKLMCKLYDSNKGKAVYSQLLQMRLIDKAVEISVAAINTNPVITGYQIEKLKILELVELITNMENEAAAKVLCNLINNDKVATVYNHLLKNGELKKVTEIVNIALLLAPVTLGYQISKLETKRIASILINMQNKDAVKLISNIYDNEKKATIYRKLLHEYELDKVVELVLEAVKESPLIIGYQIDEMQENDIARLIVKMSSVDAAKILCNMYNNDKGGAVYELLIKLGETKKALNIYKEAQIISPSKTQSQIGSIPFVYNKIFTLPSTENPN